MRKPISFNGTSPSIKFLLSSGPVAWLLLGAGVLAWGLKLEARIDAATVRLDGSNAVTTALQLQLNKSMEDKSSMQADITRLDERQQAVLRRLERLEKQ